MSSHLGVLFLILYGLDDTLRAQHEHQPTSSSLQLPRKPIHHRQFPKNLNLAVSKASREFERAFLLLCLPHNYIPTQFQSRFFIILIPPISVADFFNSPLKSLLTELMVENP